MVASGSYSVTDPIRCRSTASGSTAGRSTAVGQRHFPFGAQSGIAKFNSYFIPPTLAFLLSLLLRLGQWSRVSLQQHAVAGIGRETRSPAFPSASKSSAKFNIGAANMRLGYYLGQWGDAVPAASGRTCVPPVGPEGPLDVELLCWCCRLPASFSSRWLAATHFRLLCSLLEPSSSTLLSLRSTVDFF